MTQNQGWNDLMQFNQTTRENTFSAVILWQEQTQRMLHLSLDQAALLPREGKKVFSEWGQVWSKGYKTFKKVVDDSFHQMESFLT
jgi:hypothetical protein